MPTLATGQHYCNDRCSVEDQHVNCYNYNRNRNYGFWTEEASDSYSKLYIPPYNNEKIYQNQTLGQCQSHLKTPFVAFSHANVVAVTWKGYTDKSSTGTCYTYTQVGESCTTRHVDTRKLLKPINREDKKHMKQATTDFAIHAMEAWF